MQRIMSVLGNVAKHILGSLERAFRLMALWGLIVGVIAGLTTEGIGAYLTREFPPSGATHLAAAAIAITFGYAVAVTVAIGEILRGIIHGIELIVKESEQLAQEGIHEAELLAQRGEQEALRLGRAALGDAAALEHGVADRFRGMERGVASHVPGHHNDPTAPATIPTNPPPASR
jgi:hypothetical protein